MTYTKTYTILTPWASTTPHECLIRETGCCAGPEHDHDAMVGDPCAVTDCRKPLRTGETCYQVTELKRITAPPPQDRQGRVRERSQYVCWRHAHPDSGPLVALP
jgi:hypothetical protein